MAGWEPGRQGEIHVASRAEKRPRRALISFYGVNNLLDKSHPPYCVGISHEKAAALKNCLVLNNSSYLHGVSHRCFIAAQDRLGSGIPHP